MTILPAPGSIWSSLPVPALVVDGIDRIQAVNPAAETFFVTAARAFRGRPAAEYLAIEAPLAPACARVRENQAPMFLYDVTLRLRGRTPMQCTIHIAPLAEMADHLLVLLTPRDVVDRLGRAMQGKAAAKSAIGMAEMLAHEIKNPLAGITGAAQLLSMGLGPEDRELTDLIVAESRRIVALLEQVEQFGNLRPPACRAVNLHDILDRARRSALVGFAAQMQIIEDYDPSLPPAWGDGDQLLQVFLNLLKNAAEAAGPGGGTIRLHTFYDQALRLRGRDGTGRAVPLQVEVIDDGPGLAPEIAADIFEPFVSGHENGTGLGLALVSKIVGDHDGWIAVDSEPGRTVFRVSLPVAPRSATTTEGK